MDKKLLRKHIKKFMEQSKRDPQKFNADYQERLELVKYYQSFTPDRIASMNEDDVYEYLSKLWAMLIWGNKHYIIDKILLDNGLDGFKASLGRLLYGSDRISVRWDEFRTTIKGMGPAMISEILCKTHPTKYILWNRRAYVGFNYLKIRDLPRYDYQLTGLAYEKLCHVGKEIANELKAAGFNDCTLLAVDYFIWDQLQVVDNLSKIYSKDNTIPTPKKEEEKNILHNDIRDKLREIGQWLGFQASIEQRVSAGSRVDTVWEATIGNMGRVIYVFEVQTKGSIDSLIVNLLKALNNPAVQGVVAVSDREQLDKIKNHAKGVKELRDKLKYWDYQEIIRVHEALEYVNASINDLGLVPQGF